MSKSNFTLKVWLKEKPDDPEIYEWKNHDTTLNGKRPDTWRGDQILVIRPEDKGVSLNEIIIPWHTVIRTELTEEIIKEI